MISLYYESGKSMMTMVCYKISNNDDKSDNNKEKVCLFLKKWDLMGYVLDHMLD